MREVNIDFRPHTSPEFAIFYEDSGQPVAFIQQLIIEATVDGYDCILVRYKKNEEGLYGEETYEEKVRINKFETVKKGEISSSEKREQENVYKLIQEHGVMDKLIAMKGNND